MMSHRCSHAGRVALAALLSVVLAFFPFLQAASSSAAFATQAVESSNSDSTWLGSSQLGGSSYSLAAVSQNGYAQIEGIYAFDAATYPYGDFVTCGGYDVDSGAWVNKDKTVTVTEKGSQIQFEARGTFVSGDLDDPNVAIEDGKVLDGTAVTWKVDDESLAKIDFQSGLFTPIANGTVNVTCTLKADKAYAGEALVVTFPVVIDISEQSYIADIEILAPDGVTSISSRAATYFDLYQYLVDTTGISDFDQLKKTQAPQFWANVTVVNPVTGATNVYKVRSATELAAACGISDFSWGQALDSDKYAIDASTGMFRMLYESSSQAETIRAYTHATADGSYLDDRANLRFVTPETLDGEGEDEAGYVPSDTLTVMAYYEEYPADVTNPDDERWLRLEDHDGATSVTYTQDELADISMRDVAYTMIGDSRSCQVIATGANLMRVLQNALGSNLTTNDIAGFYFKTFDEGYMPGQYMVSADLLFQDRYCYPAYFEGGDLSGAQQVYPILAWSSKLYWSTFYDTHDVGDVTNTSTWNRDDMTSATKYRLIFGANASTGFSTKNSVYDIQTVYVVLKGGPSVKPDVDPDDPDDDPGKGDDSGGGKDEGGGTDGDGSGANDGTGSDTNDGSGSDAADQAGVTKGAQDQVSSLLSPQTTGSADAGGEDASANESSGKQTVLQMINNNEVQVALDYENALGWAVIPVGGIALVGGAGFAGLWFRRQSAPIVSGVSGDAQDEGPTG